MASLFSPKVPKPTVTPPTTMPTMDDEAVQAAKRKKAAEIQARSGRQSTILTDYSNEKLG
jgi:hypothetical protein